MNRVIFPLGFQMSGPTAADLQVALQVLMARYPVTAQVIGPVRNT